MTEQDLVMGVKRKSYKKDLSHMFDDERYSKSDKLRLLLIYLISQAEQVCWRKEEGSQTTN